MCLPYGILETMRKRTWTAEQLKKAVKSSSSFRQVLAKLGLREAGGNYVQIQKYIGEQQLDIDHFHGKIWNKGLRLPFRPRIPLEQLLIKNSKFTSHKLKLRLFRANLKHQNCEECGWAKKSPDGYLPLELDHINGDSMDNRLKNLRILCPNCHSLKATHRGRNKKKKVVYI